MRLRWNFHRLMLGQSLGFYQDEFAGRVSAKVMQTALAVRDVVMTMADMVVYVLVYFIISSMPIASSNYWNEVHGRDKGEAAEDKEGMQSLRALARNMTFLMKSIELGKEKYGLPEKEERIWTHFVR